MLIGLDGIPLTELKTGVGHYTFELARALANIAPESNFELVYPSTYSAISVSANKQASSLPTNLKDVRVQVGPIGRHWWSIGLPRYVRKRGVELFHGTNYDIPLRKRCATVLTVHDLSLFKHPETHRPGSVRRARRRLPLMVRAATLIITPSESVRRDVCERFRVRPEKVFAVPEAARAIFCQLDREKTESTRGRLGINKRFILAVGTLEPRKNLRALVRAFELVCRNFPKDDLQLVVAGGRGWLTEPILAEVEQSVVKDQVVFTGYLDDDDLRALYSSCFLFIYPSLDEGFGLPVLEAMKCGAPVVTSRIASISEVAGEAVLLVDPKNVEEIAAGIIKLVEDDERRSRLSRAGLERAAGFSWELTARMTLEVYRLAMERFTGERP